MPSEAPVPNVDAGPGRASAVSVAELINTWNVSSYPGFVSATSEKSGTADVGARRQTAWSRSTSPPQPPAEQVNWLNLFYSVEWVVFAGFSIFHLVAAGEGRLPRDLEETMRTRTTSSPTTPGQPPDQNLPNPRARTKGAAMIEPKPAIQPSNNPDPSGKKRRFGGTEAQIRSALKFYKVMAYLTGAMLLLLCAELIARYGFGQSPLRRRNQRPDRPAVRLRLRPESEPKGVLGGFNISTGADRARLDVRGVPDFQLPPLVTDAVAVLQDDPLALGGVIPLLSFIVEKKFHARWKRNSQPTRRRPSATRSYGIPV
jgi:hypothetical protein